MASQNDFFTLQSLATFVGATGATAIIANAVQVAFNFNPKWLALGIAEFICLGGVFVAQLDGDSAAPIVYSAYFTAFVNGFLVFCAAAGGTSLGAAAGGAPRRNNGHRGLRAIVARRVFFTPWL